MSENETKQTIRDTATPVTGDFQQAQNKNFRPEVKTGDDKEDDKRNHENNNRFELQPVVKRLGNEVVEENRHNASIVLGRDYRYDKLNDTSIGMVDVACGRIGNIDAKGFLHPQGDGSHSTGDFAADAARIYIAQKTDIDRLLGFEGRKSPNEAPISEFSNSRSAIGLKADAIRVVSRDPKAGISLVVEPDSMGMRAGKNSQGGAVAGDKGGVNLIGTGGDNDNMDYMVKAEPLAAALAEMAWYIQKLENILWGFMSHQKDFNRAVAAATDVEAFYAAKGIPDPNKVAANQMTTLKTWVECEEPAKAVNGGLEKFKTNTLQVTQNPYNPKEVQQVKPPKFASEHHKLN